MIMNELQIQGLELRAKAKELALAALQSTRMEA